jgi:hypothetical protein
MRFQKKLKANTFITKSKNLYFKPQPCGPRKAEHRKHKSFLVKIKNDQDSKIMAICEKLHENAKVRLTCQLAKNTNWQRMLPIVLVTTS